MKHIPRATYRLQFREGMDFARAEALVPYWERLGVSHLYASPILQAPEGSTHGYDVADHNEIDQSLGGREGFDRLSATLRRAGIGLLLDIVPNHMAASLENPWWRSVVEWGEMSPFARHFDIDRRERLTLPVLGKPFEEALAAGDLAFALDARAGALALRAPGHTLPLHPATYGAVLKGLGSPLAEKILAAAQGASPATAETMRDRLRTLFTGKEAEALQAALDARSRDEALVGRVHALQPWRLIFWQEARRHLSYRRFFEVTGLAGVRVEDEAVFADVHRLTLDLVRAGQVQGLRVDHVDGLADPRAYLARLREAVGPDVWIVVEKILGEGEEIPEDWPVEGTTGYEFIAALPDLFVDRAGLSKLAAGFEALLGRPFPLGEERRAAKTAMVTENFATELEALVRIAADGEGAPPEPALRAALAALIAAFPVYRTYGDAAGMPAAGRALLARAAAQAETQGADPRALGFVLALLSGDGPGAAELRARFQQLSGPATAKSVEDTLFYRANALIALNEVGGDPAQGVDSPESFHRAMAAHAARQPFGLLATATHDTKRGEDARARLYALSEAPEAWCEAVARWRALNAENVRTLPGGPSPEPAVEWLLFQALAGAWPANLAPSDAGGLKDLAARFEPYVEKALREAKLRTGWSTPDAGYEEAVKQYAARLLAPDNAAFLADFAATLAPFVEAGRRNSFAQTLLKLAAPGVPDLYQGTEDWDFSLVDPDNRRSVDFAALSHRLDTLGEGEREDPKLGLIAAALAFRRAHPALFARGSYEPLETAGRSGDHVAAFLRRHDGKALIAIVARLGLKRARGSGGADWGDTVVRLPATFAGDWECVETGGRFNADNGRLEARQVLAARPARLLRRAL